MATELRAVEALLFGSLLLGTPLSATAQGGTGADSSGYTAAGATPAVEPDWSWKFLDWNEIQTPILTFRVGGGLLVDFIDYSQDDSSREQVALESYVKLRDTRFILGGQIRASRPIIWQAGLMWDWDQEKWFVRQTGLVMTVPEIMGKLWIGRSKEGVSLNRVMTGYDGWTMERFPFSDASIPLLADGIKWLGASPEHHLVWTLGAFTDWLSEGQSFSYYERQVAGRLGYVRMDTETSGRLLHVGVGGRLGVPSEDSLQLRARPEVGASPYIVDTGRFGSTLAGQVGIEAYYRSGSWLFGTEYYVEDARFSGGPISGGPETPPGAVDDRLPEIPSPAYQVGTEPPAELMDPGHVVFHGGDIAAIWLITGETRSYTSVGGFFSPVSPARPVTAGGPGAWEAILRMSYIDLDSGPIQGGSFWRITPMINWHLTGNVRLELAYGYGILDRFNTTGNTHFFQTRLQTQL